MSTFSDYAKKILAGGLPAVLETGRTTTQGDQPVAVTADGAPKRVETTPPEPARVDREPFLTSLQEAATPRNLALAGAALGLGILLIYLIKRR